VIYAHLYLDIFLIRPPPGAAHCPVKPSHVIIAGDSAGGGVSLALLQVIRDSGLPPPAGGVLISPWCDLTHSFPSIHINTATVSSTGLKSALGIKNWQLGYYSTLWIVNAQT
jgi:acetyl esterase/lipase